MTGVVRPDVLAEQEVQQELVDLAVVQPRGDRELAATPAARRRANVARARAPRVPSPGGSPGRRTCTRRCRRSPGKSARRKRTPTISHRLWRSIRLPYWSTGSALNMNEPGSMKCSLVHACREWKTTLPSASVTVDLDPGLDDVERAGREVVADLVRGDDGRAPDRLARRHASRAARARSARRGRSAHLSRDLGDLELAPQPLLGQLDVLLAARQLQQRRA